MAEKMQIDVWSDIACPWCYIGKRNLQAGLALAAAQENAPEVDVVFHSYELAPDSPTEFDGTEADFLISHRNLSRHQAEDIMAHVTGVAKQAGIDFDYSVLQHTNTVLAHELLHAALAQGKQPEMMERLMAAYFSEGRHVGRVDELVELAVEAGLDEQTTREALESHRYLTDVRRDQAQAKAYGITGVPFFVVNGKYGISGAQPATAFADVIRQVQEQEAAATADEDDAEREAESAQTPA